MALLTTNSKHANGQARMPEPQGAEVVAVRVTHTLAANPTANDTAHLCDLPAGCVPVDCILDATDCDTNGTPTMTVSIGVLNAGKTDLDTLWITAATVAQTGTMARPTTAVLAQAGSSASARSIGLKFPAAAATFAAGTVNATILYRAAQLGA